MGTFINFVWVTMRKKILSNCISAKKAGKELTNRYGDYIIEIIVN